MNWIAKLIVKTLLRRVEKELAIISEKQLKTLAKKINAKVDVPKLSEDAEYSIIYNTLVSALDIVKELITLIKI